MNEKIQLIFKDILLRTCVNCKTECTDEIKMQCMDALLKYSTRKHIHNELAALVRTRLKEIHSLH